MLDGDADATVEARIRIGWNKFRQLVPVLTNKDVPLIINRIPCNTLKPSWNKELDRVKNDSIFWHNLWVDAGRPSSGVLQHTRLSVKAKYKLAINNAYALFEDKMSDEMYSHFINKRIPDFWKTWNAKFRKIITKQITRSHGSAREL